MTTTAAISQTNSSAPPQRGQTGAAADPAGGLDFLAALSRLAYSSLPVAAIAQDIRLPDTTRAADYQPADYEDRAVELDDDRHGRPQEGAGAAETVAPEDRPSQTENADSDIPQDDRSSGGQDEGATQAAASDTATQERPATATPFTPLANDPARNAGVAAPRPGAERTATQPVQSPPANAPGAETPAPSQQQLRQAADTSGRQPGAQVTDQGAKDQLPQLGHTLSSRAAVVAQSDTAKSAALAETGPKNLPGEAAAPSLFSSAAQSSGQGGQKAKGHAKAGGAAASTGVQNATTGQGGQPAGQQTQAQSPAPLQAQQQNLQNLQFGATNGAGGSGQQTAAARGDAFSLSGTGQSTPQFSLRDAGAATTAKPTPPVPPRVVTNQVAVQIQKAFGQGSDKISIQLKPAELGRVEVKLDVGKDGRVSAVITADRADTLDLLQRDARILQNSLQQAGLQADGNSLSFELKGQNQAFGDQGNGSASTGSLGDAGSEETAAVAAAQPNIISSDRIDIQI